jgi:hypothetical protein|tara:strand:- start:203 stop:1513 length:1311 start_codon:yes stop_codon:yes gene_type:complete
MNTPKLSSIAQEFKKIKAAAFTSSAIFNAEYEAAQSTYAHQVRVAKSTGLTQGKAKAQTDMSKLFGKVGLGYKYNAPVVLANFVYSMEEHFDPMRVLVQLKNMEAWNGFVNDARERTAARLSWLGMTKGKDEQDAIGVPMLEMPLVRDGNGDGVTLESKHDILEFLSLPMYKQQLMYTHSSKLASSMMSPIAELDNECMATLQLLKERAEKKAERRMKGEKKGSLTDKLILRKSNKPLSVYMVTHVVNRYLEQCVRLSVITHIHIESSTAAMTKAIAEAGGQDAQHRDFKVEGYSDLSKNESNGYCDPGQIDQIRQRYLDGDEERGIEGIESMQDTLDALELIEAALLKSIDMAHEESLKANKEDDIKPAVYMYQRMGAEEFKGIESRDEAKKIIIESRAAFIDGLKKHSEMQNEDTARYDAMWRTVRTFEAGDME